MARPCPKCKRPNNELAERCIYCGQLFPEPAPSEQATAPAKGAAPQPSSEPRIELYHVIVSPKQELKGERLAAFAKAFRLDDYSSKLKLKQRAPWVAWTTASPGEAKTMSQKLLELGLESYVIKQSGLDKIFDRVQAVGLRARDEEGVTFLDAEAGELRLNYDDLFLVVRGRIHERSERQEKFLDNERPEVQIGRMIVGAGEEGGPESGLRARISQIKVKPRPGRLHWVLRSHALEIMDLYLKNSPRSIRVVESEFDYSGLGSEMKQSGLLNFKNLLNAILAGAPGCEVDNYFKLMGHTLSDLPKEDKVRANLMDKLGAAKSVKKIFDNRTLFDDYSARVYLHHFRKTRSAPPAGPKPGPEKS